MIAFVRPGLKLPNQTIILACMIDAPKPPIARHGRHWLRYSLITLLVLGVSASIAMRWIAHRLQSE